MTDQFSAMNRPVDLNYKTTSKLLKSRYSSVVSPELWSEIQLSGIARAAVRAAAQWFRQSCGQSCSSVVSPELWSELQLSGIARAVGRAALSGIARAVVRIPLQSRGQS